MALHCNVMAHRSCSWTATQQQARTHAWTTTPGGRTAHASSIDEKGLIVKSKATSAPPRVGTTGIGRIWKNTGAGKSVAARGSQLDIILHASRAKPPS